MTVLPRVQSGTGLDRVLEARSIGVIGASPRPESVGHQVLRNVLEGGFTGAIVPIHPTAQSVLGLRAYPTVGDAPPVDLAIIAVPASGVLDVARQCLDAKVGGLVVLTAGFSETGPAGDALERELTALVRAGGMRMVGPNCLGIMNLDPAVRLNATFARAVALPGTTAIVSQSGALGIALLEQAHRLGLGVARFVSMGNKADVSGNDLLLHWEKDDGVRRIVLYLESFGNPRNFLAIARRIGRRKPILIVKSGRSARGSAAARSHTAAMAEPDRLVDALVEQCGVVRSNTVEELFDAVQAFDLQPAPHGPRVAIVTNSGGPAILAADALDAAGLQAADLAPETLARLRAIVPPQGNPGNPLDLLAGANAHGYHEALLAVADDPGVDAVLVIYTPVEGEPAVLDALAEAASKMTKTLVAVHFGRGPENEGFRRLVAARIPTYTFPENAVRALGAMALWQRHRGAPPGRLAPARGPPALLSTLAAGWAPQESALDLAATLAPVPRRLLVHSAADAAAVARDWGRTLVLKARAPGLLHKSDVGGVRLGLETPEVAAKAFEEVRASLTAAGHAMDGALAMEQAPAGRDVIVGVVQDEHFGPVLSVGLGGVYTEVLRDVALRLAPVTDVEAAQMVRSLRAWPLLRGVRGEAPGDVAALESLLMDVAGLAASHPEVQEFELNPVRVFAAGKGVQVLDARLRIG